MKSDLNKTIESPQLFYGCLHFKYNSKKYLYGITQELLTCGQQINLLSKLNGTYEPSEEQKKEKSSLLLKKEKTLLKIDYIILPRKACQHQYLWHFQQVTKKLDCRNFLILPLTKQQRKNKDSGIDFSTKKRIMELLGDDQQESSKGPSYSQYGYRFQSFKDHQNVIKKITESNSDKQKNSKRPNEQIEDFQKPEQIVSIYEQELNQLVLGLVKKQMQQFSVKSIFQHINPKSYLNHISHLINTIRHNSNLPQALQLTQQQIQDHKVLLSEQILRISSADQVFYPSASQDLRIIFLPETSMIILFHKHDIILVNPCNLASWKLHHLSLPVSKVKYVLLTRFSMAFVEFIIAWGAIGQEQKLYTFFEIATLESIYHKIKFKLKKVFLWTDQMIRSKIAFRIVPSSNLKEEKSKTKFVVNSEKQQLYPLGFIKLLYKEGHTTQNIWIIKFGDRQFCFMNELKTFDLKQAKRFDYTIFDKINRQTKKLLYSLSLQNPTIKQKLIYNRSSSTKFRNKYFVFLQQSKNLLILHSQLRIQEILIPYINFDIQSQRYQKVRLQPGESLNCLDRNLMILEGLVLAFYPKVETIFFQGAYKQVFRTQVELCYPADLINNGNFINLNLLKIRNVHELLCLKGALILIQETQNQTFYSNRLGKTINQQLVESKPIMVKTKVPFDLPSKITTSKLDTQALSSNTLIKILSPFSSNLSFSHTILRQKSENTTIQEMDFVQPQSPYFQFDELFRKLTLESGQTINQDNSKAYFVLKGLLKWDDRNDDGPKAKSNAFIGSLGQFYQQKIKNTNPEITFNYSYDSEIIPIKVVKDTYVLQTNLSELQEKYFIEHPEIAYWILQRGNLFY